MRNTAMAETEDFTLVNTSSRHRIFDDWERLHNSHVADTDTSLQAYLRGQYPELSLTVTSTGSGMLYFPKRRAMPSLTKR